MNDSIKSEQTTVFTTNKTVAVSTVGYFCIAATWWMIGMLMTGWFMPSVNPGVTVGTVYSMGSILLVILGILSLVFGNRLLDSIIFLSTAGLFFSLQTAGMVTDQITAFSGYFAWYAIVWAIFFCYIWIASLRTNPGTVRMLFLLLFWLGALAAALSGWTGSHGLEVVSGYLLLVTAILAFITSAKGVLSNVLGEIRQKRKEKTTTSES